MVLVSLIFLFVYLFGAYAYGAATLLSVGQARSLWGTRRYAPELQRRVDRASLAIFVISTIWFVLHTLIEFRELMGLRRDSILDLATFIVFLFPPVIMHTVYLESVFEHAEPPGRVVKAMLPAMYVISPLVGVTLLLAIFEVLPRPEPIGAWIGSSIGFMFILSSLYCTWVMLRRQRSQLTTEQRRLRNVIIGLFIALAAIFVPLMFMRESELLVAILDRMSRSAPLFFMVASVYFGDRLAFYDLIVKRGLLLLLSVVVLGLYLAATLPWLERLPPGPALPWLCAVALAPIALLMRRLNDRMERSLDRRWFGRTFTPVEAVKHVLAGMQPATDEQTLIAATEARLGEIFGAKVSVLVGSRAILEPAVEIDVKLTSPVSGAVMRLVVLKKDRTRRLLSEDLALLRLLGGVFGFMLENIRLQRKRIEQEQLAQDLRLQSSKSELKALRAQINPHFLFNALNAIASLIHTDPARADEAVEQLAEVFRYTLRRSDSEWAPLDQELTFARAYLDVEQARFGQRLTYTVDADAGSPPPMIPSMLLQTLLENAVKHGVSQERGPGRIHVRVSNAADQITIEVRNTGPKPESSTRSREGEGFGLHSVRERLKGHFGDRASFTLTRDDTDDMTVARITMPHARVAA
ncbi:MAG TPA: sensor histidine kinase [Vicinamibacterales bacterium]|nr:sensor histidine kinase [Vicinamibacterales bacterium]